MVAVFQNPLADRVDSGSTPKLDAISTTCNGAATMVAIVVHELGHVLAGLWVRMDLWSV